MDGQQADLTCTSETGDLAQPKQQSRMAALQQTSEAFSVPVDPQQLVASLCVGSSVQFQNYTSPPAMSRQDLQVEGDVLRSSGQFYTGMNSEQLGLPHPSSSSEQGAATQLMGVPQGHDLTHLPLQAYDGALHLNMTTIPGSTFVPLEQSQQDLRHQSFAMYNAAESQNAPQQHNSPQKQQEQQPVLLTSGALLSPPATNGNHTQSNVAMEPMNLDQPMIQQQQQQQQQQQMPPSHMQPTQPHGMPMNISNDHALAGGPELMLYNESAHRQSPQFEHAVQSPQEQQQQQQMIHELLFSSEQQQQQQQHHIQQQQNEYQRQLAQQQLAMAQRTNIQPAALQFPPQANNQQQFGSEQQSTTTTTSQGGILLQHPDQCGQPCQKVQQERRPPTQMVFINENQETQRNALRQADTHQTIFIQEKIPEQEEQQQQQQRSQRPSVSHSESSQPSRPDLISLPSASSAMEATLQSQSTPGLSETVAKAADVSAKEFEGMSREELIARLMVLEKERRASQAERFLQQQQQQQQQQQHHTEGIEVKSESSTNVDEEEEDAPSTPPDGQDRSIKRQTGQSKQNEDADDEEEEEDEDGEGHDQESSATKPMQCLWKDCGQTYQGVRNLTDHICEAHVGGGKPTYRCEWENCPRNQKPFTKRHKMCNHLRTHTGERPFVCTKPGCGKKFSRPDSLTTHIKTHSKVRPYVCPVQGCHKAYYHSRSLKKHQQMHETAVTGTATLSMPVVSQQPYMFAGQAPGDYIPQLQQHVMTAQPPSHHIPPNIQPRPSVDMSHTSMPQAPGCIAYTHHPHHEAPAPMAVHAGMTTPPQPQGFNHSHMVHPSGQAQTQEYLMMLDSSSGNTAMSTPSAHSESTHTIMLNEHRFEGA